MCICASAPRRRLDREDGAAPRRGLDGRGLGTCIQGCSALHTPYPPAMQTPNNAQQEPNYALNLNQKLMFTSHIQMHPKSKHNCALKPCIIWTVQTRNMWICKGPEHMTTQTWYDGNIQLPSHWFIDSQMTNTHVCQFQHLNRIRSETYIAYGPYSPQVLLWQTDIMNLQLWTRYMSICIIYEPHSPQTTLWTAYMYIRQHVCAHKETCESEKFPNWIAKQHHFYVFGLPELNSEVASLLRVGPEGWLQYQG